ncbi:Smr/MutS family protein [Inquilinus sp. CAU 1745]|uniref:Smr/MutS family protein n=1 Tax=Inquilinus sp. CAU 1745 TaxID=3140369 RepID=UPI00325BDD83
MSRSRKPTADEKRLWRAVMQGVTPLRPDNPVPEDVPPPAAPADEPARRLKEAIKAAPLPAPKPPLPPLAPGKTPGLDRRSADRLRRGRMDIDGRLDLHGMSQAVAHDALTGFVLASHRMGRRAVLVITGKGLYGERSGVLKSAVPRWLNDAPLRDKILAFQPAQPKDGGSGALYVLLKRRRDG